eukprot:500467-Pleurochrysis_carterae.AAC.1
MPSRQAEIACTSFPAAPLDPSSASDRSGPTRRPPSPLLPFVGRRLCVSQVEQLKWEDLPAVLDDDELFAIAAYTYDFNTGRRDGNLYSELNRGLRCREAKVPHTHRARRSTRRMDRESGEHTARTRDEKRQVTVAPAVAVSFEHSFEQTSAGAFRWNAKSVHGCAH